MSHNNDDTMYVHAGDLQRVPTEERGPVEYSTISEGQATETFQAPPVVPLPNAGVLPIAFQATMESEEDLEAELAEETRLLEEARRSAN